MSELKYPNHKYSAKYLVNSGTYLHEPEVSINEQALIDQLNKTIAKAIYLDNQGGEA